MEKDIEQAMKQPHNFARRLLVAVTGLSPQIVTETLYALAVARKPRFIPTEVRLITTEEGAERAKLSLLHADSGWFHRLRADYDLPPISFGQEHIHVLEDDAGAPLSDIRTPADNARAADAITDVVSELTRDDHTALHVSIAGGRKTMGFYLGYALSLYGRQQDRLSHVLVSAPYESHPKFFYPTVRSCVIHTRPHNRPHDTRDAKVTLADIPFVRLRSELPEDLLDGKVRFGDAVTAAQRTIAPELVIDLPKRRLRAAGRVIALPPVQLAFLAWLARQRKQGKEWLACPSGGAPEMGHAEAFLKEYRKIVGDMGDDERTTQRLRKGMTDDFFSQTKTNLHKSLNKKLGRRLAASYLVSSSRPHSRRLYGLDIAPNAIRFESFDLADNLARKREPSPVDEPPR